MNSNPSNERLTLPSSLESQLHDFRRHVWKIKGIEATCGAAFGVLLAYLLVFGLDRVTDTPGWLRMAIFLIAVAVCAWVPVYLHRWIWCHRRLEQLARLVSRKQPLIGDQLLGVIELVKSDSEQARSRVLVEAAVRQVAEEASKRDFTTALPAPRHRLAAWMAAIPLGLAILFLAIFPSAASNAWARFLAPWQNIPRYTFTGVKLLPEKLVVPHGEPIEIAIPLTVDSQWKPARGKGWLGNHVSMATELRDGQYDFLLPAQIDSTHFSYKIGDAQQRVRLVPMLRPELTSFHADVTLPEYLQRTGSLKKDIRGGSVALVKGSTATFNAIANRTLVESKWWTVEGEQSVALDGAGCSQTSCCNAPSSDRKSPPLTIASTQKLIFEWKDEHGLKGLEPFTVSITARDDEAPTLACEDLPRQKIVLDTETLTFKIRAQDDFGVKNVGIEWLSADKSAASKPAKGERLLGVGGSDQESLELAGTFCARTLDIEPQPVNVRLYAEDYLPGRPRVYSAPYLLYVLSPEQHAIWITEQLSKWHRQSLEVRDREMQLHHDNQELRMLSAEQLDQPENRRRIEAQSAAEKANGRRLTALAGAGEELVRQAMRNPEFGVGHLEKWAEMLQILKDISGNRMPNVADLLKQSAQSQTQLAQAPTKQAPAAGNIRDQKSGTGKSGESKPQPAVPSVVDRESSQQPAPKPNDEEQLDDPKKSNSKPRLGLPTTTVAGSGGKKQPSTPAAEKLDEAITAQQDLLAEFEKIADELNKVLANLEGSTLVKRLKAASRQQYVFAGKVGDQLGGAFGRKGSPAATAKEALKELSKVEEKSSLDLSTIMDDMQAYFERRRMQRFKTVLDEMREQDAVGSLRQLADDVKVEAGLSIAQAEFWSDTLDRWADDLVDPACAGKCPGCKSKSSLPPSIVLEAMQILEAEVNLREETRVSEQARKGLTGEDFSKRARKLGESQDGISDRVNKLTDRIRDLPDGETEFGKEIALLKQVEQVMGEAADILDRPETGAPAIAAETEAIELLLQSKKFNPSKGGGGGGASPGGGGGGSTNDPALALIGRGSNEKEVREDRGVQQATGETGTVLPEEFRAGLDEYFKQLERTSGK